jgi:putative tricarboxylic transport membrane protein
MVMRGPKNVFVGIALIALALLFGVSSLSLHLGSAGRMGPGYFPLMLAVTLGLLGTAILAIGLFRTSEWPGAPNIRGIVLVGLGVVVFALGADPLGMVPTVFFSSLLFSLAGREFRPVSATVAGLILAFGSWALFIIGLGMPWAPFGYLFS